MIPFLHGFRTGFHQFGLRVNGAITFIVLIFVYIFGIGITSVIGKLAKKNFMELRAAKPSYWKIVKHKEKTIDDYKRSF